MSEPIVHPYTAAGDPTMTTEEMLAKIREVYPDFEPTSCARAMCPICGRVFEVTEVDDCFWPVCGHFSKDAEPLIDGLMPWCCEHCGIKHALQCKP